MGKIQMGRVGSKYEEVYLLWAAWRNSDYWPSHIMKDNFSKWIQILRLHSFSIMKNLYESGPHKHLELFTTPQLCLKLMKEANVYPRSHRSPFVYCSILSTKTGYFVMRWVTSRMHSGIPRRRAKRLLFRSLKKYIYVYIFKY